eukprot:TRINITY_DN554_c0_g3_i1.p1 TRINITY_DN554_c0_g3~~TRINITY_DN554_c0_g3_i1.p1  ORF type:complete len:598 (+),score=132.82 TRINITY_DN554_c0_g3_i1:293-2086(+)
MAMKMRACRGVLRGCKPSCHSVLVCILLAVICLLLYINNQQRMDKNNGKIDNNSKTNYNNSNKNPSYIVKKSNNNNDNGKSSKSNNHSDSSDDSNTDNTNDSKAVPNEPRHDSANKHQLRIELKTHRSLRHNTISFMKGGQFHETTDRFANFTQDVITRKREYFYFVYDTGELTRDIAPITEEDVNSTYHSTNEHYSSVLFNHFLSVHVPSLPLGRTYIRDGKASLQRTLDPNEADVIYAPVYSKSKKRDRAKKLDGSGGVLEKYFAKMRNALPAARKCDGCNVFTSFDSGGGVGVANFLEIFPRAICLGVDSGNAPSIWSLIGVPYPTEGFLADPQYRLSHGLMEDSPNFVGRRGRGIPAEVWNKRVVESHGGGGGGGGGSDREPPSSIFFFFAQANKTKVIEHRFQFRRKVRDIVVSDPDSVFIEGGLKHLEYYDIMRMSTFCACPFGVTPASQRMDQAALNLCIPVILSDLYELPYRLPPDLSPHDIAVFHPVSELDTLLPTLHSYTQKRILEMKRNLARIYKSISYPYPSVQGDALHTALEEVLIAADLSRFAFDRRLDPVLAFTRLSHRNSVADMKANIAWEGERMAGSGSK